jgi:hypothetical protein
VTEKHPDFHVVWARTALVLGLGALLVGGLLYVFQSVRNLPGEAVRGGRAVLGDLEDLAKAFTTGTVTTSFVSFATEVGGGTYFQFAQLRQQELFERRDDAATLWGALQLPEVVVRATAPVETTYILDLKKPWDFHQEANKLLVVPPPIEFNTPAVDVSKLEFEVRAGSLLRDEAAALERLKGGITAMARRRARENIPLVREIGRQRTEEFVRTWLAERFVGGEDVRVQVIFRDEWPSGEGAEVPLLDRTRRDGEVPGSFPAPRER